MFFFLITHTTMINNASSSGVKAETIRRLKQTGRQMSLSRNKTFCAFFFFFLYKHIFLQVIHQSAVKLLLKCSQLQHRNGSDYPGKG